MFKDKTLLITGGTGSFGNAALKQVPSCEFFRVPADKRGLNYVGYFDSGEPERERLTEFNSNNTEMLDVEAVNEKLSALTYIQDELGGWKGKMYDLTARKAL